MQLTTCRRYNAGRILAAGLSLALLSAGGLSADAQQSRQRRATLEEGTVLPVVLDNQLSSNKSRKGDRFTAKIKTTESSDYLGLPEGTRVEGVVVEALPKKDSKTPGILDLDFRRVRLPDGNSYAINSELIPLDEKSVETKEDGRIVAKPGQKREDLKYVGYGAAAGALISLLGNRGRITIENILLGGLAGFGVGQLIKGPKEARDVVLKPGTEIGLRLVKPLRFTPIDRDDIPEEDRASFVPLDDRASPYDFGVLVNDRNVVFGSKTKPFQSGNTYMLPVRPMLEATNSDFRYNSSNRSVQITDNGQRVRGTVGSRIVILGDGSRRRLSKPLQLVNGELVAPADFFEIATRTKTRYDDSSNTLVFASDLD
jgi:hypothetical protein